MIGVVVAINATVTGSVYHCANNSKAVPIPNPKNPMQTHAPTQHFAMCRVRPSISTADKEGIRTVIRRKQNQGHAKFATAHPPREIPQPKKPLRQRANCPQRFCCPTRMLNQTQLIVSCLFSFLKTMPKLTKLNPSRKTHLFDSRQDVVNRHNFYF